MSLAKQSNRHEQVGQPPSATDPLSPMRAANYDPSMPCFDHEGVAALARSFGVFSITRNSVKRATLAKELKAHKVSSRLRWSEDDVRAWLRGMTR